MTRSTAIKTITYQLVSGALKEGTTGEEEGSPDSEVGAIELAGEELGLGRVKGLSMLEKHWNYSDQEYPLATKKKDYLDRE